MEALLLLSNDLASAVERAAPSIVTVHARQRRGLVAIWPAAFIHALGSRPHSCI